MVFDNKMKAPHLSVQHQKENGKGRASFALFKLYIDIRNSSCDDFKEQHYVGTLRRHLFTSGSGLEVPIFVGTTLLFLTSFVFWLHL